MGVSTIHDLVVPDDRITLPGTVGFLPSAMKTLVLSSNSGNSQALCLYYNYWVFCFLVLVLFVNLLEFCQISPAWN